MVRYRKRGGNFVIENRKSKIVLILLTLTGLVFWLDRMYSNQIGLGVLETFTAGGFGIWYIIDAINVIFNALTRSQEGLFGITGWNDDVNTAFNVTVVFILSYFRKYYWCILKMKNKNSSDEKTSKLPLLKKQNKHKKKKNNIN